MGVLTSWEQGDVLAYNLCVLLSPPEWCQLRASHGCLARRLDCDEMTALFTRRLKVRATLTLGLGDCNLPEDAGDPKTPLPVLALASAVVAVAEVLNEASSFPNLTHRDLQPVHQVLRRLHNLALKDRQLMPRERRGRRSSLQRRLLRQFAAQSGLILCLVSLLKVFGLEGLPEQVFVDAAEVIASLIHNAKESKRSFLSAGGLEALLVFLRAKPEAEEVQAAGMAALLALSARSVPSIHSMAIAGAHEVAAAALSRFPFSPRVVARAAGLLANMSNVPSVCPSLQQCGVLRLAQKILDESGSASPDQNSQDSEAPAGGDAMIDTEVNQADQAQDASQQFVRDFVQYLMTNLEEHGVR